ncbi:MAG: 1-(5-phosphoribosyl)-5-[(5-phosphoribosylamino)methylideneamino]imidazole-4-carboxamide isomerase [Lactobacillaceae bacterium]|jgi:phosphoribosylformimino-5-aminoimidazole carboxamide ribotide isomerase|nr:1-(5-phosphoribosyl)-5-[(5-phosphoribosylamino)methylideneamino]imidazole-4-carboxamide isomerase [Lactobacillaceae bacterium]
MILPAIDLLDGKSVRLFQGDYNAVTTVNADPIAQTQTIQAAGLNALHVVDLDGAKAGTTTNLATITEIRANFAGFIEVGGGIRTMETIQQYQTIGINRVILGSAALKNPLLVTQAVAEFGELIAVGIDGKDGFVATEGWLEQSAVSFADLLAQMQQRGVKNFIVTDIARDGTLTGPNVELLAQLQTQFKTANIIASGGIAKIDDVLALQAAGINDVIVGKALAAGKITLAQLKEVAQ